MKALFRIFGLLLLLALLGFIFLLFIFRDRRPPIYFAAETGDTNLIARYLASGTNINALIFCSSPTAKYELAPMLHIAVANGQLNTVKFLLVKGANPNQMDADGNTPLLCAIGSTKNDVALETRTKVLSVLLANGADPNLTSPSGFWTPLIQASYFGDTNAVRILLTSGAHVGQTNHQGSTPLHFAGNAEIARLLISVGADPNAHTGGIDDETPADSARRLGHFGTLEILTNLPTAINK